MSDYVVELKHVTKKFPGVVAMRGMHIQIRPGEIHGLIGENGAGKSTLIKVLTGVYVPEEGEIFVEGRKVSFSNPVQAREHGITCVYQELNIVPMLPVVDNVFMGRKIKNKLGLLDYPRMHREAKEALAMLGQPGIDTKRECGKLGVGLQQMVEIAKAVTMQAKLLIMDEPTSSLGEREVKQLMETVRKLKDRGIAILFVSHKLEELFELCDRVTVMRDGEHILTADMKDMTHDRLIQAMVGRTWENQFPKVEGKKGESFLKVENLKVAGVLRDVSFEAFGGQITAFAGLVGAGRTETMRAIFAADKPDGGTVYIKGKRVSIKDPGSAIRQGIAFLTEDRKGQGLVLSQPVKTNMILASMKRFQKGPMLRGRQIEENSKQMVRTLRIKTPSVNEVVVQLSGGNQQKVVIGKWINCDVDIYIFDEPTRGIDVGAKVEVYNIMNELVRQGKCIIMVSSELPEVLGMSDKVVVMREGRVMATIHRGEEHFNQEDIMKAAWGGKLA
ncbi:MAG: sugar ABC transporter ATP-binding protein [Candidatus Limiplasma sp.]|nr:sugar ABC transporter ATP-binding protein [Candidatus Limiplasma sp.]